MTRTAFIALLILAALSLYQWRTVSALRAELRDARTKIDQRAGAIALEKFANRRRDLTNAGMWLHQLYQSEEGLKRPEGLWIDGHPDFEGIGAWLFDVYLRERIAGASEEAARKVVVDAIRQTPEWKDKHPLGASNGRSGLEIGQRFGD